MYKRQADDKTKVGGQDRRRINLNEDYELRDWSKKFGVSPERLKEAVASVGDQADKVESFLRDDRDRKPAQRAS